jgi:hypothetical protein
MEEWIEEELEAVALGDERLDARMGVMLERLSAQPQASLVRACRGRAEMEAAYRFCANPKTTPEMVLAPHRSATIQRIGAEAVVLLAHDTTEADYTGHEETEGLGSLDYEYRIGLLNHVTLAMTPERVPLGVIRVAIWGRREETRERDRRRAKKRPVEAKESYRWVVDYEEACAVAEQVPGTQIISVRDRESDLYEVYECWAQAKASGRPHADFVVRLCQNRRVQDEENPLETIRTHMARWPERGQLGIRFKKTKARPAGEAILSLRAGTVRLAPPYRAGATLSDVTVNVVWVREIDPPAGEKPIEWILLTSLPVESFEPAALVVSYYACRWEIEVFFRILKGGCLIEDLQLQTDKRLAVAIALYLIVAWRVHYVMKLGRQCPDLPCTVVFEDEEWMAVWTIQRHEPLPAQPPSLGDMVTMVARLGGYLARSCDGPPGPKVLWIGLQRAKDFAAAWKAFGPRTQRCVE